MEGFEIAGRRYLPVAAVCLFIIFFAVFPAEATRSVSGVFDSTAGIRSADFRRELDSRRAEIAEGAAVASTFRLFPWLSEPVQKAQYPPYAFALKWVPDNPAQYQIDPAGSHSYHLTINLNLSGAKAGGTRAPGIDFNRLGRGELIKEYVPDAQRLSSTLVGNDRFLHGRPYVSALGLYDHRARFYDPETLSFLQPDPLGPVDSPNLYQGFGFDALNVTDPSGMGGPTISVGQLLDMARVEGVSEAGQRDLIAAHQMVGEFSLGLGQAAYGMVVSGGQQALRGSIRNSIDMALHVALRIQQAKRSGGTTGEGLAVTFTDFLQLTPLVEGMEGWEVYGGPLTLRQSLRRAGQGTFGLGITTLAVAGGVRTIGNAMSMDFLGEATMGGWLEFGEEMSQEASLAPGGGVKALPEFVLPRGFSSLGQFRGAIGELDDILLHHGIDDAVFRFRGSSTTGLSMNPNKPGKWFSLASDIDLSIESRKLSEMLYTAGQRPSRNVPGLFLPNKMGRALPPQLMDDLAAWNARWTRGLGIKNIEPAVSDPALVIHDITNVVYRPR